MAGSLTKGIIGKEDLSIQTNTSAAETFTRLASAGSTISLTKFPDIWDGTGKIAALVLVWIYLFWPALIKAGYIGRFMTPLVRAYPEKGNDIVEFFYEEELQKWLDDDPSRAKKYQIIYYKETII